jgi:predicted metal-dependent phosphoesterase TrpH
MRPSLKHFFTRRGAHEGDGIVRCDLHLHSRHSGPADIWPLSLLAHESYTEPRAVYGEARRRDMDLVTLTDHDTIAGALEIAALPGTFVSEEVSCILPGGRLLHVGVFGISEAQHEVISRRRTDAESLFAYLAEERIPAAVNHLFSALTGRRATSDFHRALSALDLVEARNGMMSRAVNARAARAGRAAGLAAVGGSDAHTLASVARAFTVVPDARNRDEFLEGLRRGLSIPAGRSGGYVRLTADLARITAGAYGDSARSCRREGAAAARLAALVALLPLLPLLPLVTAGLFLHEQLFARRHERALAASRPRRRGPAESGPFGPAAAASPAT